MAFYIDISNITVQIEGEEIKPGIFTYFQRQWVPESISLADGYLFIENNYYLITSYRHPRGEDSLRLAYAIFQATETSDTFLNPSGLISLHTGAIFFDEIYIQEIRISGNEANGFVLHVTPRPTESFTVEEGSARSH